MADPPPFEPANMIYQDQLGIIFPLENGKLPTDLIASYFGGSLEKRAQLTYIYIHLLVTFDD